MRWEDGRRSDNVEDRRGSTVTRGAIGGGAVIVAVVAALLGAPEGTVRDILNGGRTTTTPAGPRPTSPAEARTVDFVKVVLGYTEDAWRDIFAAHGKQYQNPKLRLFSDEVDSACGFTSAAVGPFYCPPDRRVYLDLSFFNELARRFGAPGEFAEAYVIAHEVGHHVQNLLGTSDAVQQRRAHSGEATSNHLSVLMELQADCYAGVWAHETNARKHILDPGDADEALRAAAAIGDDTLQRQARGRVVPESFTHGTSAQRVHWFQRGFTIGKLEACDTFSAGAQ
jgi:predicted metalloprotease